MLLSVGCPGPGGADEASGAGTTGSTTGTLTTMPDTETGTAPTSESTTSAVVDSTADSTSAEGSSAGTTGESSGSSSGDDRGSSTGEPLEEIDCAKVPTVAESAQLIVGPRGYHGLAITDTGIMIGSDGASLIQSDYDGNWSVFIPGTGNGEQLDLLPDGDIAFNATNGDLQRLGLDATIEVIHPGVFAYGVTTGADGMVYVVSGYNLDRIDPDTGMREELFVSDFTALHAVDFSPDGRRAYVATVGGTGDVLYADFDEGMTPISTELELFATGVGEGSTWHDAVAVDACGNLYVPNFSSRNMYRVTPDGTVNEFWDPMADNLYGHGAVWGNGVEGWDPEALYVPQPYNNNTVTEVIVGVPARDYAGPVINVVPMDPPPA